jgi:L-2-hydroxyglutarate oxidase
MGGVDVVIVGAGIVGLATAYRLAERHPGLRITVLDKEPRPGLHQTGRNSGVLHSGIYYRPGSLKAVNCREGKKAMEAFCAAEGLPFEICGKVIVAVDETELPALETIHGRGVQNGVRCSLIGPEELRELEPQAAGIRAIHVPEAGIVDYRAVCQRLRERISALPGSRVVFGAEVTSLAAHGSPSRSEVSVDTSQGRFRARYVVNCGGLQSDRLAALGGAAPEVRIVPFRGEYYELVPEARSLVRNLIYPVPRPEFPFLGVHFTRRIDGSVECGPNAVLALGREAYEKFEVHPGDLFEALTYPGFLRLAAKYWRVGLGEAHRSLSKAAFVTALQRLLPAIRSEHLVPAPAGIRAQAVARDGTLVDDFLLHESEHVLSVVNAPSPAATASLNIGKLVAERVSARLALGGTSDALQATPAAGA